MFSSPTGTINFLSEELLDENHPRQWVSCNDRLHRHAKRRPARKQPLPGGLNTGYESY